MPKRQKVPAPEHFEFPNEHSSLAKKLESTGHRWDPHWGWPTVLPSECCQTPPAVSYHCRLKFWVYTGTLASPGCSSVAPTHREHDCNSDKRSKALFSSSTLWLIATSCATPLRTGGPIVIIIIITTIKSKRKGSPQAGDKLSVRPGHILSLVLIKFGVS